MVIASTVNGVLKIDGRGRVPAPAAVGDRTEDFRPAGWEAVDLRVVPVGESAPRPELDTTLDARTGGDAILGDPAMIAPDVAARPTVVGGAGSGRVDGLVAVAVDSAIRDVSSTVNHTASDLA